MHCIYACRKVNNQQGHSPRPRLVCAFLHLISIFFEKSLDYSIPNTVDCPCARRERKSARKTFPTHPTQLTYNKSKTDMKATLLALLTLGSLAMAAEEPKAITIVTDSTDHTSQTVKCSAGDYDAVVFTLKNDASRFKSLDGTALTSTVTLTSLMIAADNNTAIADKSLIVTDNSGLVLGFSNEAGITSQLKGKEIWGDTGLDYTRNFTTWSSIVDAADFSKPLTLSLDTQYCVYFATEDQIGDLPDLLIGAAMGWIDPVNVLTYQGDPLYTRVRLATIGEYDAGSAAEYTFKNGTSFPSQAWAPYMSVTVQHINVPEPTTGTLSLLALAGLCIRRRK